MSQQGIAVGQSKKVPKRLCKRPFGLMLEVLDDLKPNAIYLNTGSSSRNALWGELMSIRAGKLGAAGAVVNGCSRATNGILSPNLADNSNLSKMANCMDK
jgi:regulator of RNase E activity RraA